MVLILVNHIFSYIRFPSRNWTTHGNVYLKKCTENDATPHKHAQSVNMAEGEADAEESKQSKIGTFFTPAPPEWSSDGLRELLLELSIELDKVCCCHIQRQR
jgi:hypothetical protein